MLNTIFHVLRILFILGRFYAMYKTTMNAMKGIGLGMLTGAAVAAIGTKAMNGKNKTAKQVRKNAGKAIHTMGTLLNDVEKMVK